MDKMAKKLEFERVLGRTIVHVDMDAYYAAVEMRDDPKLKYILVNFGSGYRELIIILFSIFIAMYPWQ